VTILEIAQLGDPILRQTAIAIGLRRDCAIANIEDPDLQILIDSLIETAKSANGVGIAAPQVSQSYRLFIVASRPNFRYPNAPIMEPTAMLNPKIISHSETIVKDWEGCLSVPGPRKCSR
jgi:peptide deformylase